MPIKTDRKDARGIAQLMRLGWFRPVHCKSLPAQEVRAMLTARKLVQSKLHDVPVCRSAAPKIRHDGARPSRDPPRLRPESRPHHAPHLRRACSRAGRGTSNTDDDRRCAVGSTIGSSSGISKFRASGAVVGKARRSGKVADVDAGCGRVGLFDLCLGDRRSRVFQAIQAGWRAFRHDAETSPRLQRASRRRSGPLCRIFGTSFLQTGTSNPARRT